MNKTILFDTAELLKTGRYYIKFVCYKKDYVKLKNTILLNKYKLTLADYISTNIVSGHITEIKPYHDIYLPIEFKKELALKTIKKLKTIELLNPSTLINPL